MKHTLLKRILLLLLAAALLGGSVLAEPRPGTVTADSANVLAGAVIDYTISIADNPGLAGFRLDLEYDTDVLTPEVYENSREVVCTRGSFSNKGALSGALTKGGCQFMWYHTDNVTTDGTLLHVRFRVSEEARPGVYPIRLRYSPWDVVDREGNPVALHCVDGAVEVHSYRPLLYTESFSVKQGQEFDFPVNLRDNPGIAALKTQLLFDKTKVRPVLDGSGHCICTPGANFANGTITAKGYVNAAVTFWYQASNATGDGTVFTVRLRALEDAEIGPETIRLEYDETQTLDQLERPVHLDVELGTLEILPSSEVRITRPDARTLTVEIRETPAREAVTALYSADGQMLELFHTTLTGREGTYTYTLHRGETASRAAVFLLDDGSAPVCPAAELPLS